LLAVLVIALVHHPIIILISFIQHSISTFPPINNDLLLPSMIVDGNLYNMSKVGILSVLLLLLSVSAMRVQPPLMLSESNFHNATGV
jgi:hypothetical protein